MYAGASERMYAGASEQQGQGRYPTTLGASENSQASVYPIKPTDKPTERK
jgi:hypothetical protein